MEANQLPASVWKRAAIFLPICAFFIAIAPLPNGILDRLKVFSGTRRLPISDCPGYTLASLSQTHHGLIASLSISGVACNAFGEDVNDLTLEVTYESPSRLHVNIYDTAKKQYTIPESLITRPPGPLTSEADSDLVFNYESQPFAFWITRRHHPDSPPLFDTRPANLPLAPAEKSSLFHNTQLPLFRQEGVEGTSLEAFPLVFEDRFLQITSVLPYSANIYGLGEYIASSGFRRDIGTNGGIGTLQTLWARDIACPIDENLYGTHPMYLEHRHDPRTGTSSSHGVFLMNAAGADVILRSTSPDSAHPISLIQYRLIGGTLDFYFLSGPSPIEVVEQYSEIVGKPARVPDWAFGFHLCRWGYDSLEETKRQVQRMKDANIPLEVMWNDIDMYQAYRDFTSESTNFPADQLKEFTNELALNGQHYIPIVDAGIAVTWNETDRYDPYTNGLERDVFIKNVDGSSYVGQVWPGYTVFPDWSAKGVGEWWEDSLRNWTNIINWSGIWLDMNEVASFCEGSCGTGALDPSKGKPPFLLPGEPGAEIIDYPEGYNASKYGPSGNITLGGKLTYEPSNEVDQPTSHPLPAPGKDVGGPAYSIHNGFGRLSWKTIHINAVHQDGSTELDVHSLWGLAESKATYEAIRNIKPRERPFIISRSTFASSGRWTGHWLGDNFSTWKYMYLSIQGMLQFQLFQIPMVGADTCGFGGNTDEELCNRWMQLAAFTPFFRNHNIRGAIGQEPYRWDSVAAASRTAIAIRYSLLPYWTSLFAAASLKGTPPIRPLFFEFPNEPELLSVDRQWLVGPYILVTPVLSPNMTTVEAVFPGQGNVIWRDWYDHAAITVSSNGITTLVAPLGHINLHIRDGSVILMRSKPGYTIAETREFPFKLLVSLSASGSADSGWVHMDDGISIPDSQDLAEKSTALRFQVRSGKLESEVTGSYDINQKLEEAIILGIPSKPQVVYIPDGKGGTQKLGKRSWEYDSEIGRLILTGLNINMNRQFSISWSEKRTTFFGF